MYYYIRVYFLENNGKFNRRTEVDKEPLKQLYDLRGMHSEISINIYNINLRFNRMPK